MFGSFDFSRLTVARRIVALFFGTLLLSGCPGTEQKPDPVVADVPIAYIKRPVPVDEEGALLQSDVREPAAFVAGGDVYLRERASLSAPERNITAAVTRGKGDVKDLTTSFDGSRLLFALREPEIENAPAAEQPTWNIWEYDIAAGSLRRVISSDISARAGQDIAPAYLPDGRIVFASTRQRQSKAILLDEGKPQFAALDEDEDAAAFLLHVMNADGSEIRQLTFNQSHDLDPTVLDNGRIAFTRWDNMGARDQMSLYQINPDGTDLKLYYGAHSHQDPGGGEERQFLKARQREDGQVVVAVQPYRPYRFGRDITVIDAENFADASQPVWPGTAAGVSAERPATAVATSRGERIVAGGRYASAAPLRDGTGRLLVSWSPCRLVENDLIVSCTTERLARPGAVEAPPLYSIYVYDLAAGTQLPVVVPEEGVIITEAVAASPRKRTEFIPDLAAGAGLDAALVDENAGELHIRSVYDVDGVDNSGVGIATLADPVQTPAAQRPLRFIRVVKAVSLPGREVRDVPRSAFGPNRGLKMREVVAYAPVEPDGSVLVKVPANVALSFELLDERGRRVGAVHQNWLQLRPGERVECNGCHDHASGLPHGRRDGRPAVNAGAVTSGLPFPNTTPAWTAEMGETMAQTRARLDSTATTGVDLVYDDVWTDPAQAAPSASFAYRYADLGTDLPVAAACLNAWSSACRIVIHYEQHIHPLWSLSRQVLDTDGVTVLEDHTCTTCHNIVDGAGMPQLPAAQLDLSDGPSDQDADQFKAYRELLFADNEQELVEGVLQDRQVQATDGAGNPLFETDENGDLILDADGQPIPILVPVRAQGPSMSAAGAASSYFLDKFTAGGSHEGWLSPAELRLIAEWLDGGAQYYNDPFAAPEDD
ncbi:MAG TPA: hypothetical protein ENJ19_01295 [Gammaproteobacteria bacterium]|nr:hypothetical protein [Gammaproteobacteria bacterium]